MLIAANRRSPLPRRPWWTPTTALRQQELSLKNLISRTGAADPVLANVRIVPIDSIAIPASRRLAPINEMVRQALANRPIWPPKPPAKKPTK